MVEVEVEVVTKMVYVRHDPGQITPAALLAALNDAHMDASLTSSRGGRQGEYLSG